MARVVVIDDYQEYAEMAAGPLRADGHEVLCLTSPIDFDQMLDFKPDVLSVGLYRQEQAFDRPIENFEADVLGYKPLKELERYPAITALPILLIGSALHETDVPTRLRYDTFLVLPRDITIYPQQVAALIGREKRRKLSGHICPNDECAARLARVSNSGVDLYCPRCGTGVAVDGDRCHYLLPGASATQTRPLAGLLPEQSHG